MMETLRADTEYSKYDDVQATIPSEITTKYNQ